MSKVGEFLQTTAMGGLFVLLPVLLLYLLLAEALDLVIALARSEAPGVMSHRKRDSLGFPEG